MRRQHGRCRHERPSSVLRRRTESGNGLELWKCHAVSNGQAKCSYLSRSRIFEVNETSRIERFVAGVLDIHLAVSPKSLFVCISFVSLCHQPSPHLDTSSRLPSTHPRWLATSNASFSRSIYALPNPIHPTTRSSSRPRSKAQTGRGSSPARDTTPTAY